MECVGCGGLGCDECGGVGSVDIADCPMNLIDRRTQEFIEYAELYIDHGLPPVAGGSLDQAASFLAGCRFVAGEIAFWKNKLGIING